MIVLPLFKRLIINNYELFPGATESDGINFVISNGVTLIAGINGLGKTTLLNTFFRLLTGPADLAGTGLPSQIGSILPEQPVPLRQDTLRYFGQRVSDDARTATASLEVTFGRSNVRITRNLRNLTLSELQVGGQSVDAQELEKEFRDTLCHLMNVSSFVDVLMLLHYVVFFPERRPVACPRFG